MAANEISVGNNVPPPATTSSPQAKAPSPAVPKVTVEEVSKVADNKKSRSVNELAENAAEIREAISEINKAVKKVPTSLDFSVDEASKRFVVQVTDTNTGEVIRKLPGDAVLRIARQLESMKGVVFDQKF
ncbi:flagellar protein FlaG [Porticoccaceae bacterium]|jgi:flagellar protein FlaG|nr:flagellar protein FlaG [Porticoccaceae bacterium]